MHCGAMVGSGVQQSLQFLSPGTGKSCDLILFVERLRRFVCSVVLESPKRPVDRSDHGSGVRDRYLGILGQISCDGVL